MHLCDHSALPQCPPGAGVIWVPEIYPGSSTAHRDRKPPGTGRIPRAKGAFLWEQFAVGTKLHVQTAFVGMFDELYVTVYAALRSMTVAWGRQGERAGGGGCGGEG